jgi:putative glutamine amidotransferase
MIGFDMRPLIGITIDTHDDGDKYESPFTYALAVEKAGGLPVLLPYRTDIATVGDYLDRLDGVLLSGGNDLDPSAYGASWHPRAVRIDPARQAFESALLTEIERRRMPVLGVCLGSQLMNVHRGGTLHQFLPDIAREPMLEHRKVGTEILRHPVAIDRDSILHSVVGVDALSVNTYHKQAVDKPGRGLKVTARAPDGVVEAFEDPNLPLFLAVQWHPERLHDEPGHLALFRKLVESARSR